MDNIDDCEDDDGGGDGWSIDDCCRDDNRQWL